MFHNACGDLRDASQRLHRPWYSEDDLSQRRVVENPAARAVTVDGTSLAPGGESLRQTLALIVESA
jgi:hypothetical protein